MNHKNKNGTVVFEMQQEPPASRNENMIDVQAVNQVDFFCCSARLAESLATVTSSNKASAADAGELS
jgi:hypothetical protein